ncbi:MAG: cyclic nucleotide-binding domain-containing protein [Fimbriimonadaceae bacterium]|nr:cyclic nucleotide-binding domain-containing protein [Fimbriimonadaceae bacterium]
MSLVKRLRGSYLVAGLSDDDIASLSAVAEEMRFAALEEIVREGSIAEHIYVILEGKARVTTSTGDLIARLGAGAVVGELALFEQEVRTATVVADTDCVVMRATATALNGLIDDNPRAGVVVLRNLGRTLCQRLRSSNVQLESVLATL